jgi:hypothetical protein
VVSNDAMNQYAQRVVVVPLTSNVDHCYPGEALVTVKGKRARALGDQLRSIDRARLRGKLDPRVERARGGGSGASHHARAGVGLEKTTTLSLGHHRIATSNPAS